MATTKRRARMAPVAATRTRPGAGQSRRTGSPLLLLALIGGTVVVLAAILVFALSRGSTAATPAATAVPTAAGGSAGAPIVASVPPTADVGVIDSNSGLAQPAAHAPAVGVTAPDFAWVTQTGNIRLSAMRGHPVLLEFFAPWCAQCKQDVPLLNGIALGTQYKGVQVVAVSATPYGKDYETSGSENPIGISDLSWFHQTFGTAYQEVFDPGSRIWNLYGRGQSYPTFFLIDSQGIVRFTTSRYISNTDLLAQVGAVASA